MMHGPIHIKSEKEYFRLDREFPFNFRYNIR